MTKERLDRCVVNSNWRKIFKETMVEGITTRTSDHAPLIVSFAE